MDRMPPYQMSSEQKQTSPANFRFNHLNQQRFLVTDRLNTRRSWNVVPSFENVTRASHCRSPNAIVKSQIAKFGQGVPTLTTPQLHFSFTSKTLRHPKLLQHAFSSFTTATSSGTPLIRPVKLIPLVHPVFTLKRTASFDTSTPFVCSNPPAFASQKRIAAQANVGRGAHYTAFNAATIAASAARLRTNWTQVKLGLSPLRTATSSACFEKSHRAKLRLGSIAAPQLVASGHVMIPENVRKLQFVKATHHDQHNTAEIGPNKDAKIESTYHDRTLIMSAPADAGSPSKSDLIDNPTIGGVVTHKPSKHDHVLYDFPESSSGINGPSFQFATHASNASSNDDQLTGDLLDRRHSISAAIEHEEREYEESTEYQFLPVEPFTVDDERTAIRKSEAGWGQFVNEYVYTWHPGVDFLNSANNDMQIMASMPPFRRAPVPKNIVVRVPPVFATLLDRVQSAVLHGLTCDEDQSADTCAMVQSSLALKDLVVLENTVQCNTGSLPSSNSCRSKDGKSVRKLNRVIDRASKGRFCRVNSDSGSIYDNFGPQPQCCSSSDDLREMLGRQTVSWARFMKRANSMENFEQAVVHTFMGGSSCLQATLSRGSGESTMWGTGKRQQAEGEKKQRHSVPNLPVLGVAH